MEVLMHDDETLECDVLSKMDANNFHVRSKNGETIARRVRDRFIQIGTVDRYVEGACGLEWARLSGDG